LTGNLVTDTVYRLDIDKWFGDSRVFADFQKAQVLSNYRTMETHAENMGQALARQLDTSLIALVTSTSISPVVNASTAGIKSSDLEAAIGIIESYNIPREECIFFFHPKVYIKMHQLVVMLVRKFRKFGESLKNIFETIPSQALSLGTV
jgi:hypothetical protein